jgi:hypothetical protein
LASVSRGIAVGVVVCFGLMACDTGDPVLPSPRSVREAVWAVPAGRGLGRSSSFTCYLSERSPAGPDAYRYTVAQLHVPPALDSEASRTTVFRVHVRDAAGAVLAAATCRVPEDDRAIRWVRKRFEVLLGELRPVNETLQPLCVTSVCSLPPLVVTAPPSGGGWSGWGGYGGSCDWWDCDDGSMGDDYGGGDYYDPAYDTPAGEPIADDETVDCHLADEGVCDLRLPTPEELARGPRPDRADSYRGRVWRREANGDGDGRSWIDGLGQ